LKKSFVNKVPSLFIELKKTLISFNRLCFEGVIIVIVEIQLNSHHVHQNALKRAKEIVSNSVVTLMANIIAFILMEVMCFITIFTQKKGSDFDLSPNLF
jgi:hypothetical protein